MNVVVHQAALGDWVLTFPILRALRGRTLAVAPGDKARLAAALIRGVEACDIDRGRWFGLFAPAHVSGSEPAPPWPERLAQAELVLSFVSDGRDAWADNIRRLAPRARHCFVQPRPPADWREHVLQWQLQQMRRQQVDVAPLLPGPRSNPAGPIVIHPGSGGRDKCWPLERFEELLQRLRELGHAVQPVLGEAELERWPPAIIERWRQEHGAVVPHALAPLLDVLAGARLYVGNDAGPTHLAAQMGLPTVALFGPTSPIVWAPLGPNVRVLAPRQPANVQWLRVESVLEALPL